jgi:hypothetical protein
MIFVAGERRKLGVAPSLELRRFHADLVIAQMSPAVRPSYFAVVCTSHICHGKSKVTSGICKERDIPEPLRDEDS